MDKKLSPQNLMDKKLPPQNLMDKKLPPQICSYPPTHLMALFYTAVCMYVKVYFCVCVVCVYL